MKLISFQGNQRTKIFQSIDLRRVAPQANVLNFSIIHISQENLPRWQFGSLVKEIDETSNEFVCCKFYLYFSCNASSANFLCLLCKQSMHRIERKIEITVLGDIFYFLVVIYMYLGDASSMRCNSWPQIRTLLGNWARDCRPLHFALKIGETPV